MARTLVTAQAQAQESGESNGQMLVVGRFGAPHGVRGWVKLHSFTEPRDQLLEYHPLRIKRGGQWQEVKFAEYRSVESGLLVRVDGVEDRDEAALLRNCDLAIADTQLPELDAGEYYWRQLIGLEVISRFQGQTYRFGQVTDLLETGANDVLVVQGDVDSLDLRQRLIPYEDQFLLNIDLSTGSIEVDWDPEF